MESRIIKLTQVKDGMNNVKLVFGTGMVKVKQGVCNYCGMYEEVCETPISEVVEYFEYEYDTEFVGRGRSSYHFSLIGDSGYLYPKEDIVRILKNKPHDQNYKVKKVHTAICISCAKQIAALSTNPTKE